MTKSGIFLMAAGFLMTAVGIFTTVIPIMIIGGVFFGLGGIVLVAKIFTDGTKDQKKGKGYAIWGIVGAGLLTAGVMFIPELGAMSLLLLIPGGILLMILLKYGNALNKKKEKNDDDEASKW